MKRRRSGGFTFVEMALATAISATLAVALSAVVVNGIRIWQRTSVPSAAVDLHVMVERLAEDCANMVPWHGYRVETDGTSLSFYTVSRVDAAEAGVRLTWVAYRYDPLRRVIERLSQEYADSAGEQVSVRIMLESVDACLFSVLYDDPLHRRSLWSDQWPREQTDHPNALPRQVRVAVTTMSVDVPPRSQQLIYSVPIPVRE